MERAQVFYEKTLGITLRKEVDAPFEILSFPHSPTLAGCGGSLIKLPKVEPGPGGTLVYFSTPDCEMAAKRATEAGGAVVKDKFSIGPRGWALLLLDTEGNMVGLQSQV